MKISLFFTDTTSMKLCMLVFVFQEHEKFHFSIIENKFLNYAGSVANINKIKVVSEKLLINICFLDSLKLELAKVIKQTKSKRSVDDIFS